MSVEYPTFWMVWRLNWHGPNYEHSSREAADKEAKRLSRQHPGEKFVVLKSASIFECEVMPVTKGKLTAPREDVREYHHDDIPF